MRALLFDPGGLGVLWPVGPIGPRPHADVAFHHQDGVGTRDDPSLGAQSHGPYARCLRFVTTVARVLLTVTQDSLPAGGLLGRASLVVARAARGSRC